MTASGYIRQAAANISSGLVINADDFNAEYNQIQAAFDGTAGHDHSGGSGLGQKIGLTSAVTGILPSANGGTGIAYVSFTGPTVLRTFTLPDSNATLLTTGSTLGVINGGTGLTSGTSGGIPYFSSTSTIASSALLTANALILGGGAGATPVSLSAGTSTTILHGNAAGAPTWGAVSLSADVTGILPANNGGTGIANNIANTITFSGNYGLTFTLTGSTGVTLPVSGTLVNSTVTTLSSLSSIGTIATGVWQGTKIGLAYGGTNADLSATGGTSQFLRQASSGAAITVAQVSDADLSTTDITTNNVSTSKHGFAPRAPNDATKYLDGTGAYSVPAGNWKPLSTQIISSSTASVSVTTGIDSTYSYYIWVISNLTTTGGGVSPYITVKQSGSFVSTGYYSSSLRSNGAAVAAANDSNAAQFTIDGTATSLSATTPSTICFEFYNPSVASQLNVLFKMFGSNGGASPVVYAGAGNVNTSAATTGIKLTMSSGNIATCIATLYGVT